GDRTPQPSAVARYDTARRVSRGARAEGNGRDVPHAVRAHSARGAGELRRAPGGLRGDALAHRRPLRDPRLRPGGGEPDRAPALSAGRGGIDGAGRTERAAAVGLKTPRDRRRRPRRPGRQPFGAPRRARGGFGPAAGSLGSVSAARSSAPAPADGSYGWPAFQSPERPPVFSRSRTPSIRMPRSTAFTMS